MRYFYLLFILLFTLSACNVTAKESPTLAPAPTSTVKPTNTSVPQPTSTLAPTATLLPTLEPETIGKLVVTDDFSISVPFPLLYQVDKRVILIGDEENSLNISFASDTANASQELIEVIDLYLASFEKRGWQITKGASADIQIDNRTGLIVDLAMNAGSANFEGQAVAASSESDIVLFGLAISNIDDDKDSWKNKGRLIFEDLIGTIKFINKNAECPISTDETYGYTETNPVQVGGGDFEGPSRERAYLDHLHGPNGDELSYEREGSIMSADTILDIYHITGTGIDETIYVDEYNFSELQAPIGFICQGAFPLSAP